MMERKLKEASSAKSQGINSDVLRKKHEEMKERKTSSEYKSIIKSGFIPYSPREGDNQIRIVPPLEVAELQFYGMDVFLHRNVGPAGDIYLCLKRMNLDSFCQICKQQTSKLWEEDREKAISLYPEEKTLIWVIDLLASDAEVEERGLVQPWLCPKTKVVNEILSHSHKKELDIYVDVSHPEDGRVIYFDKKGKGKQTVYSGVQISEKPYPLPDNISQMIVPFMDALNIPTQQEIKESIESLEVPGEDKDEVREEGQEPTSDPVDEPEYECFGKQFGEYQDCDGACPKSRECSIAKEENSKPSKPSRVVKSVVDGVGESNKKSVAEKLAMAMAMANKKGDGKTLSRVRS